MHRNESAPIRLARLRLACLATTALLGAFLLLTATAAGARTTAPGPSTSSAHTVTSSAAAGAATIVTARSIANGMTRPSL